MTDTSTKLAIAGISIAISILFTLQITFNFYDQRQFNNIYNYLDHISDSLGNISKTISEPQPIPPIVVNVTLPNQTNTGNNVTTPGPNVTQPTPTPTPTPAPTPVPTPVPPQPTCKADEVYDKNTNECIAKPKPVPPAPVPTPFSFTVTGDVEDSNDGTAVFNQVKKQNANYDFVLGDLGYANDLSWFQKTYGSLGDKMYCVAGNHESDNEDGTAALEAATLKYCGNAYWFKKDVNLFLFFNTNGDLPTQNTKAAALFKNATVINGVKNIFVLSHKPCATGPNQHHPYGEDPEVKTFCDKLKTSLPTNAKVYYLSGHNHVASQSADKKFTTSGNGGRSHYTCGVSTAFPFCDNSHYGFVKVIVAADSTVTFQFLDYNGKILH